MDFDFDEIVATRTYVDCYCNDNISSDDIKGILNPNFINKTLNEIDNFLYGGFNYFSKRVPFTLAGGSLLSYCSYYIATKNDYGNPKSYLDWLEYSGNSDIDLFFECEEDYIKMLEAVQKNGFSNLSPKPNAKSFYKKRGKNKNTISIDLVHKDYSAPQKLIDRFDLNKSKIAISSYGNLYIGNDFDNYLCLNPLNINYNTISRFKKYSITKHIQPSYKTLQELVHIFIDKQDEVYESFYNDEKRDIPMYGGLENLITIIVDCKKLYNIDLKLSRDEVFNLYLILEKHFSEKDRLISFFTKIINEDSIDYIPKIYELLLQRQDRFYGKQFEDNMDESIRDKVLETYPEIMF